MLNRTGGKRLSIFAKTLKLIVKSLLHCKLARFAPFADGEGLCQGHHEFASQIPMPKTLVLLIA